MIKVLEKQSLAQELKAVVVYIVVSICSTFIFALILSNVNINKDTIWWINQFIKTMCIFAGCFTSLKQEQGLKKGIATGLLGAVSLYLIFMIFGIVDWNLKSLLLESLFLSIAGGTFGVITVNFRRN